MKTPLTYPCHRSVIFLFQINTIDILKMKKTEIKEVINASVEKIWDVLFMQYGDIHIQ